MSTSSRCCSSNGGSFTNTLVGTASSPCRATRARPVVPELRSTTAAAVTSRPSTSANQSAVSSSTTAGSIGGGEATVLVFSETDVDLKSAVDPEREDARAELRDRGDEPDQDD